MSTKIPGYTDYVTKKVAARLDQSSAAVQDFIAVMQMYVNKTNGQARMIKAGDLAWELEELASNSAAVTTYPDDWLLYTYHGSLADLIEVMEPVLKAHGVNCFVVQKEQYVLPDMAKNRYVFFYKKDPFGELNAFRKAHNGMY